MSQVIHLLILLAMKTAINTDCLVFGNFYQFAVNSNCSLYLRLNMIVI